MTTVRLQWRSHRRPQEGLALFWTPVPAVLRYACIIGYADLPAPALDAVMRGAAPGFTLLGIPPRFTGAVDVGSPAGEVRQYSLVAYCAGGELVPVEFQVGPGRQAPRDREYHSLMPQPLTRPPITAPTPPVSGPAAAAQPSPLTHETAAAPVEDVAPPFGQPEVSQPAEQADASSRQRPAASAGDRASPPEERSAASAFQDAPVEPTPPEGEPIQTPVITPFRPDVRGTGASRNGAEIPLEAAPIPMSARPPVATPEPAARAVAVPGHGEETQPTETVVRAPGETDAQASPTIGGKGAPSSTRMGTATEPSGGPNVGGDGETAPRVTPSGTTSTPMPTAVSGAENDPEVLAWMRAAEQAIHANDQWAAVDLYEQALARYPEYAAAQRGLKEARALAQWSAQMAGAGDDARRLMAIGDAFAASTPALAARSYEAAFAVHPTIIGLRQWLAALHAAEGYDRLPLVARRGVDALRAAERVHVDPAQDSACADLAAAPAGASGLAAVERLIAALVASARPPRP